MDILLFCMLTAACQLKQREPEPIKEETIELASETATIAESSKAIQSNE